MYVFQGIFMVICLVVPLAWLLQLTVRWTIPLRPKSQQRKRSIAEVLHARSSLCLSADHSGHPAPSLLEINKVASFIALATPWRAALPQGDARAITGCWNSPAAHRSRKRDEFALR